MGAPQQFFQQSAHHTQANALGYNPPVTAGLSSSRISPIAPPTIPGETCATHTPQMQLRVAPANPQHLTQKTHTRRPSTPSRFIPKMARRFSLMTIALKYGNPNLSRLPPNGSYISRITNFSLTGQQHTLRTSPHITSPLIHSWTRSPRAQSSESRVDQEEEF